MFVVDDDDAVRVSLAFALDMQGFDIMTFGSGEALLLYDLPKVRACLIIDHRLPGLSGLETIVELRVREVRLPALLVTSNPGPHLRSQAETLGIPIAEKPLMGDTLITFVRNAVAH